MEYQLWDLETRNLIDEFDEEADALETVRAYLTPDAEGAVVEVGLVQFGDGDQPVRSIHGDELRTLAFGTPPTRVRGSV